MRHSFLGVEKSKEKTFWVCLCFNFQVHTHCKRIIRVKGYVSNTSHIFDGCLKGFAFYTYAMARNQMILENKENIDLILSLKQIFILYIYNDILCWLNSIQNFLSSPWKQKTCIHRNTFCARECFKRTYYYAKQKDIE